MNAWGLIVRQFMTPIAKAVVTGTIGPDRKVCTCCGEEKPIEDFYPKADGRHFRFASQCKPCQLEKNKEKRSRARNKKLRIAAI